MKTVLTAGTFGIPHMGHAIFLERSARLGDHLIVCLGTDEYVEEYKGQAPVFSYAERAAILQLLPFVDEVIPNPQDDLKPIIDFLKPDIITIGSDWGDKYFHQIRTTPQWLAENGTQLVYLPYTREISTTQIIERSKQWQKND